MIMDDKTIMISTLVVLVIAFTWGLTSPIRQFVNQVTVAINKRTKEAAKLNHDAPQECNQTPAIPISVISHLVLPFIQDRRTWNNICSANKELYEAGMRMTPPWPETKLMMLGQMVGALEFSPCGSFLASGSGRAWSFPKRAYICDRRGKQTSLTGHTSCVSFLSFSNDGKYLASAGSHDKKFDYGRPTLQGCLNSLIKRFEGTTPALLLAWISHHTTQISWPLGTLVRSSFGMLSTKYAYTVLITDLV